MFSYILVCGGWLCGILFSMLRLNGFVVCFSVFGKVANVLNMFFFQYLGASLGCFILVYLDLEGPTAP